MNISFTSFVKFLESKERATVRLWKVTYVHEHNPNDEAHCIILEWESSNCKWYKPRPLEGREECGYCFSLYFPNINAKIIHIREA